MLSAKYTFPANVVPPKLFTVSVRVAAPDPVKLPLNVKALLPLIVPSPPHTMSLASVRAPPPACKFDVELLLRVKGNVLRALLLPRTKVPPSSVVPTPNVFAELIVTVPTLTLLSLTPMRSPDEPLITAEDESVKSLPLVDPRSVVKPELLAIVPVIPVLVLVATKPAAVVPVPPNVVGTSMDVFA